MIIDGHKFFNLFDATEKVTFVVDEIELIAVQPVGIELVEIDSMKTVKSEQYYLVIINLSDGRIASSKPITQELLAHKVAAKLAKRCENFWDGKSLS